MVINSILPTDTKKGMDVLLNAIKGSKSGNIEDTLCMHIDLEKNEIVASSLNTMLKLKYPKDKLMLYNRVFDHETKEVVGNKIKSIQIPPRYILMLPYIDSIEIGFEHVTRNRKVDPSWDEGKPEDEQDFDANTSPLLKGAWLHLGCEHTQIMIPQFSINGSSPLVPKVSDQKDLFGNSHSTVYIRNPKYMKVFWDVIKKYSDDDQTPIADTSYTSIEGVTKDGVAYELISRTILSNE